MSGFGKEHDDMWDDSELIDSWNEALAEYKKYHSMAARGETVNVEDLPQVNKGADVVAQEYPIADEVDRDHAANAEDQELEYEPEPATKQSSAAAHIQPDATVGAQIGIALPAHIKDENLKNLMMSWYYAGYYTGLYEGGQRGCQQCSDTKPAT